MSNLTDPSSKQGAFITGTDTDVGKTYVACCIAKTLIKQGLSVTPRKPIASGCIRQPNGTLLAEDALHLQQACQSTDSLQTICPYQFEPPISPQRAIQEANLTITIQNLVHACQNKKTSYTMVEGAGGFYSPLALDGLNKDLAIQLNFPVILVVANRIGCINQALLSIEAIQSSGLTLHSIIVNQTTHDGFNYAQELNHYTHHTIFNVKFSSNQQPQIIKHWKA
ncbi:MAG: dethiobiotin synthase [Thiomicrorhabdus sp.]|nr:dethiobiotin synthase [Thiomicrorhabdus sp.]